MGGLSKGKTILWADSTSWRQGPSAVQGFGNDGPRQGTCAAVLLWPETLDDQSGRRLQLAAEKGRSWAIAFRPPSARRQPSAAALRLELQTNAEGTRVHILKSRGGRPAVIDTIF